MPKPIWLLDVDGVINAVIRGKRPQTWPHDTWHKCSVRTVFGKFPVWYSDKLVEFINSVHRAGKAEIVWLTTWETDAQEWLAPALGLDRFERVLSYQQTGEVPVERGWWKLAHVQRLLEKNPNTKFVWTDDDIVFKDAAMEVVQANFGRLLALSPIESDGLTPHDTQVIAKFLDFGEGLLYT